jgi:hypothetical protein
MHSTIAVTSDLNIKDQNLLKMCILTISVLTRKENPNYKGNIIRCHCDVVMNTLSMLSITGVLDANL